jgi:hypothetical protein
MPDREGPRRAVLGWLERVADAQDVSPALEPGALADARRLSAALRPGDGDLRSRSLLGWLYYYRCLGGREQELGSAIENLVPCFVAGEDGLPEDLLPLLVDDAIGAATRLLTDATAQDDPALARAAADLWGRIVDVLPLEDPLREELLTSFGIAQAAAADAGRPEAFRKRVRAFPGRAGGGRMRA